MKHDWKKIVEEPVSREAQDRMFKAADHFIDQHLTPASEPSFFAKLLGSNLAFTMAGAAAAFALFLLISVPKESVVQEKAPETARLEPELLRNVEMLLELETLENWTPEKQARQGTDQWKKDKT